MFGKLLSCKKISFFLFIGTLSCISKMENSTEKSAYGLKKLQELNKKHPEITDKYLFLTYQKKISNMFKKGPVTLRDGRELTQKKFDQFVAIALIERSQFFSDYYSQELTAINLLLSHIKKNQGVFDGILAKPVDESTEPKYELEEAPIIAYFSKEIISTGDIFKAMYFKNYKPKSNDVFAHMIVELNKNDQNKIDYEPFLEKIKNENFVNRLVTTDDKNLNPNEKKEKKAIGFLVAMEEEAQDFLNYLTEQYRKDRIGFFTELRALKTQLTDLTGCLETIIITIENDKNSLTMSSNACAWIFASPTANLSGIEESNGEITAFDPDQKTSPDETEPRVEQTTEALERSVREVITSDDTQVVVDNEKIKITETPSTQSPEDKGEKGITGKELGKAVVDAGIAAICKCCDLAYEFGKEVIGKELNDKYHLSDKLGSVVESVLPVEDYGAMALALDSKINDALDQGAEIVNNVNTLIENGVDTMLNQLPPALADTVKDYGSDFYTSVQDSYGYYKDMAQKPGRTLVKAGVALWTAWM